MKIRYANCWEDAEIVLRALRIAPRGKYLVICSAGDLVLSLLSKELLRVVAVDTNPAQIACLELKKAAFRQLPYERVLQFLGITNTTDRVRTYHHLRGMLSQKSARFWDNNHKTLCTGIIHAGTTEKHFHRFRKLLLPLLMNKRARESLFESPDTRRTGTYTRFPDSRRWEFIMRILFSRLVLKTLDLGRTPSFYSDIYHDIGAYVRRNIRHVLTRVATHDNPYLEYIVRGNFVTTRPLYLQKQYFNTIRQHLDKISFYSGGVTQYLENSTATFNGFYFSDIFEYMTAEQCKYVLTLAVQHSRPKASIVYWTNLRARPLRMIGDPRIHPQNTIAQELFLKNRAFFYSALVIGEVR